MRQVMPSASEKVERYTPAWIFKTLGTRFRLDPAAPDQPCPSKDWCDLHYTKSDDGLSIPWRGRVWLNPPWTRGVKREWVHRLWEHGDGIALVRGGIDSRWLHDNVPDAILLLRGRLQYLRADGVDERGRKGGAVGGFEPSMLLAYGRECAEILLASEFDGIRCDVTPPPWEV